MDFLQYFASIFAPFSVRLELIVYCPSQCEPNAAVSLEGRRALFVLFVFVAAHRLELRTSAQ